MDRTRTAHGISLRPHTKLPNRAQRKHGRSRPAAKPQRTSIGKLGLSPDQLGYYERQVAQAIEDYFSGRGEAPGRWIGGGCAEIGVSGRMDRAGREGTAEDIVPRERNRAVW